MTTTTNKLKSGAIAFGDQMVVSAGTFLTLVMVSRNCSAVDVGIFSLTWTIVSLVRTVQERLIAAPFIAFTYQPSFDRPTFRGSSIFHQLCFATVCTLIIIFVSITLSAVGLQSSPFILGSSLAVALFLNLLRDHMRAISYTDFTFLRLLVLDSVIVATQLGGLLLLSTLNRFSIISANLVIGISCLVPVLLWLRRIRTTFEIDSELVMPDWKHNWRYSRWLVGGRIIGIAPIIAIPWLIALFEGKAGTGAYAVCSSLVGLSMMFVQGTNNMFQPRTVLEFQKNGVRGMVKVLVESILVVSSVLTCVSVLFWFLGGNLLSYYGSSYSGFGYLAFLLSISTLIISISCMMGNGLVALNRPQEIFWGEVACCVVGIVAAFSLIPSHGLYGAGYSSILGSLAATVVTTMTLVFSLTAYDQESVAYPVPIIPVTEEMRGV